MTKPKISIILPVYNEEDRVININEIYNFLEKFKYSGQVILVNDGSSDQTLNTLKKLQKKFNFEIVSYGNNKGKGYALRLGVKKARGESILLTDIDLSVPINHLNFFMEKKASADILIGSRRHPESKILSRQSFWRETLGKWFTSLAKFWLGLPINDFTCGFKLFKGKIAKKLFAKARVNRWAYDAEILFLAKQMGAKIKELPVVWSNDRQSKVRFPGDLLGSLVDLIKIRFISRL
ncbi:glycosyltransferase [Candidatus Roizmanbacteria bacterium]|nr:glycosyltransferase [Candidatus Roizmanbacteria bacterium]